MTIVSTKAFAKLFYSVPRGHLARRGMRGKRRELPVEARREPWARQALWALVAGVGRVRGFATKREPSAVVSRSASPPRSAVRLYASSAFFARDVLLLRVEHALARTSSVETEQRAHQLWTQRAAA